jgi:hypothetical protein
MFQLMSFCSGLAAIGLLAGAIWSYFKQKNQMESRAPTTGTVVELVLRSTRPGRSGIYCPVVEFTAPSGERIRFTSDFGSRPAGHKIGQSVKVRYDPAEPQKAEIESGMTLWLAPLIFAFMGTIACCLTVFFLLASVLGNPSFNSP